MTPTKKHPGRPATQTKNPLALRIRAARRKAKLSADDAAARAGMSRVNYYEWERGIRANPPLDTLSRIAAAASERLRAAFTHEQIKRLKGAEEAADREYWHQGSADPVPYIEIYRKHVHPVVAALIAEARAAERQTVARQALWRKTRNLPPEPTHEL